MKSFAVLIEDMRVYICYNYESCPCQTLSASVVIEMLQQCDQCFIIDYLLTLC